MARMLLQQKNEKVIINLEGSLAEVETTDCSQPEADSRIILHVSNYIQMCLNNVVVFEQTILRRLFYL